MFLTEIIPPKNVSLLQSLLKKTVHLIFLYPAGQNYSSLLSVILSPTYSLSLTHTHTHTHTHSMVEQSNPLFQSIVGPYSFAKSSCTRTHAHTHTDTHTYTHIHKQCMRSLSHCTMCLSAQTLIAYIQLQLLYNADRE